MISIALLSTALLTGCQSSPSQQHDANHQSAWVAKDLSLKQCEQTSAKDALDKNGDLLRQKQVQVLDTHCADDGMMRIQVCGASQGKMGVYKIAAFQMEQAESLGFKQVKEDQYQQIDCS